MRYVGVMPRGEALFVRVCLLVFVELPGCPSHPLCGLRAILLQTYYWGAVARDPPLCCLLAAWHARCAALMVSCSSPQRVGPV